MNTHTSKPGPVIGIIGGGQLAQMLFSSAIPLGIELYFLALEKDESLVGLATNYDCCKEYTVDEVDSFAQRCDVITFEHELVAPTVLHELEARGHSLAPRASAMVLGSDKSLQRALLSELDLPVPNFSVAFSPEELLSRAQELSLPLVLKSTTGGYDGRGVIFIDDLNALEDEVRRGQISGSWVIEERLELDYELAVIVTRNHLGEIVHYEPVETVQDHGICVSVTAPAQRDRNTLRQAGEIAERIAQEIDLVGTLAVEFFVSDGQLFVNELAPRVHNSGHLTIEAAKTSQFENHLRAVGGLPLGDPSLISPAAMVNLIAPTSSGGKGFDLQATLSDPSVKLHDYRKSHRVGRKVGHITALASSSALALQSATLAASEAFRDRDHKEPTNVR